MDARDKFDAFRRLHEGPGAFVIANVWDAGSARLMAGMGFKALATSSGAAAGALGRVDGRMSRAEAMANAAAIVAATDLPVSADLENGFGDEPAAAAATIREAGAIGLAGASIEDFSGTALYPVEQAVKRIEAAVAARNELGRSFLLTARAENFLRGNPDLDDTIRRLQAYQAAGADVLMAPVLPDLAAVEKVCRSLQKPFSFMAAVPGKSWSLAELEARGVRRISVATSLYRAAMTGLLAAAREIQASGTFGYLDRTVATAELNKHFEG